jgi:2-phospho-L-lactate transferase/gluconeogenesis factor (CofD/UPF0052 family)
MGHSLVVSLFCGGRGSAALVRELSRRPYVRLNLLINAYDDGLSTGEIREFIPGMLGPSDFRKNLSYLLDLHSNEQYALTSFLEYRLPKPFDDRAVDDLSRCLLNPRAGVYIEPRLCEILQNIEEPTLTKLRDLIFIFLDYSRGQSRHFNFADCSLGNLLFAGAYIRSGRSFNEATSELAALFGSRASLINVTSGENRILAAFKEDGELLAREACIVGKQSRSKIGGIFLLKHELSAQDITTLSPLSLPKKLDFLRAREAPVYISPEADKALRNSDIIVFGSGTQHSSLLPSYKTIGVREAIIESKARAKILIANIHEDHDIQGFTVTELVDRALYYLGDWNEGARLITHILCPEVSADPQRALRNDIPSELYRGAREVKAHLENPTAPGTHSGSRTATEILKIFHNPDKNPEKELQIYVDLNRRSLALPYFVQELCEIDWRSKFSHVTVVLNLPSLPELKCPSHLSVHTLGEVGERPSFDMAVIQHWLKNSRSKYLVTLTGDGEYRLYDVLSAIQTCEEHAFGAVYGSRTQSRRQLLASLQATYAESRLLFALSWFANFLLVFLYGLRFQVIFSDPLTGFRVYEREALSGIPEAAREKRSASAAHVTKLLLAHNIEIAEIPVSYRTYSGFNSVSWRIKRGLRHILSLIS